MLFVVVIGAAAVTAVAVAYFATCEQMRKVYGIEGVGGPNQCRHNAIRDRVTIRNLEIWFAIRACAAEWREMCRLPESMALSNIFVKDLESLDL